MTENGGVIERLYHALARRWPVTVAYSLAGATILWAYSLAGSHPYRAVAAVAVHHNVERAHPDANERELSEYIIRETALLETVAYSDAVWDGVFESLATEGWLRRPDSAATLFDHTRLPHPADGEWQFVASANDPALSARLANLWAGSFVDVVNEGVAATIRAEALRARVQDQASLLSETRESCSVTGRIASEIEALLASLADPSIGPTAQAQLLRLAAELGMACEAPGCEPGATDEEIASQAGALAVAARLELEACQSAVEGLEEDFDRAVAEAGEAVSSLEVSAFLEASLLRQAQAPSAPYVATGWYLGVGGLLGIAAWALREGFRPSPRDERKAPA